MVRATGLESLAFEAMGRTTRLNLSRLHIVCALSAAALRVARKMERARLQGSEGSRLGEPSAFQATIPGGDSVPPLAENLKRWFNKYLEDIQDLAGV